MPSPPGARRIALAPSVVCQHPVAPWPAPRARVDAARLCGASAIFILIEYWVLPILIKYGYFCTDFQNGVVHARRARVGKALAAAAGDLSGAATRTTDLKWVPRRTVPRHLGSGAHLSRQSRCLHMGYKSSLVSARGWSGAPKRPSRAVAIVRDRPGWSICVDSRHANLRATVPRRAMATQGRGTNHAVHFCQQRNSVGTAFWSQCGAHSRETHIFGCTHGLSGPSPCYAMHCFVKSSALLFPPATARRRGGR